MLAGDGTLHGLGVEEVVVEGALQRGHAAADDGDGLGRKVLGQHGVCAAEDELVDEAGQLVGAALAQRALLVRGKGLAAGEDGLLELAPELRYSAQEAGVGEVDHGEKLLQVVLHRRPAEEHAPPAGEGGQRLVGQRLVVLQPVCLVADEEVAGVGPVEAGYVLRRRWGGVSGCAPAGDANAPLTMRKVS